MVIIPFFALLVENESQDTIVFVMLFLESLLKLAYLHAKKNPISFLAPNENQEISLFQAGKMARIVP